MTTHAWRVRLTAAHQHRGRSAGRHGPSCRRSKHLLYPRLSAVMPIRMGARTALRPCRAERINVKNASLGNNNGNPTKPHLKPNANSANILALTVTRTTHRHLSPPGNGSCPWKEPPEQRQERSTTDQPWALGPQTPEDTEERARAPEEDCAQRAEHNKMWILPLLFLIGSNLMTLMYTIHLTRAHWQQRALWLGHLVVTVVAAHQLQPGMR